MKRYFKGWYFKQQNENGTVGVIPAIHVDKNGNKTASIQIITEGGAMCDFYPFESFHSSNTGLSVNIANNFFSDRGMIISIKNDRFSAEGSLCFTNLYPPEYDIMGPFKYIPFMECRHSVFSLSHRVHGKLRINGREYIFKNAPGYIEGDSGRSFPSEYAWTQCNYNGGRDSLMLSVADIPMAAGHFTGVVGFVFVGGHELRIATYLGAKAKYIGDKTVVVTQGDYTLSAQLCEDRGVPLYAPVTGGMTRQIREGASCRAKYRFLHGQKVLFDFQTDRASFEYEYKART